MIITISGDPGAGKSVVSKELAKRLGYTRYYMGKIHREYAREKGLDLNTHLEQCRQDPTVDREVDEFQKTLKDKDDIIVEGRTSFHFLPDSIKVFFRVEPDMGARRIIKDVDTHPDERNEAVDHNQHEEVVKVRKREAEDRERYRKLYGIDILDMSNYDIIIDSTQMGVDQQVNKTLEELRKHGLDIS